MFIAGLEFRDRLRRDYEREVAAKSAELEAVRMSEFRPTVIHRAAERLAREIESYLVTYTEFFQIARGEA